MHQPSSFRVLIESAPPNLGDRTSKDVHKNWPQLRSLPRVSGINLTQKRKCKPNCICRMSAAEVICLGTTDRKSTRLNSSHPSISYAVFCLKKKTIKTHIHI